MSQLNPHDLARYSRQIILPGVGREGQERLADSRVLVVGMGGLGSPVALYLAAAGVGTLGLADFDVVELNNLHRQILHNTGGINTPKTKSARERLLALNPGVKLEIHERGVEKERAIEMLARYDVVVDGSDNFPTRYLVNDAAVIAGKPLVYGSIFQFEGQVSVFDPARGGPCYRCLFPEMPRPGEVPNCAEAGVFGALCGQIGSTQAMEALKLLLGMGEPLLGRLMVFDALAARIRELRVKPDPACPLCGANPSLHEPCEIDYSFTCETTAMEPATNGQPPIEISVEQAREMSDALFVDVREPFEWDIAHVENARHLPLGEVGARWETLPKDRDLVVYCHHGMRSLRAVEFLRQKGLERATSMAGGIDAWATEVEPDMPRY